MTRRSASRTTWPALVPALAATLLLAGCAGGGGVEFEGKIFEAIGLSDLGKPAKDPKVADRAPLIVPPAPKLPEPGARAVVSNPENWPVDEREVRARELASAKQKLEKYRRHGDFSSKSGIDEFEKVVNPLDRRPGALAKRAGGTPFESGRDDVSADDLENIANGVDMEKLKAERRREAEEQAKDPDQSWVSKPGDERAHCTDGPDDIENMKGNC